MNLLARHVILRALLRWTAAVAFCIPLKHRPHARLRALGMLLPLLGLTYVLDPAAQSTSLHELQFSLLTLYVAFFVLLGMMIYACVEIDKKSALYCAVWSLLASQTAYECWHLVEVFFEWRGTPLDLRSLPVMLAQLAAGAFFYFVICTTLSRKMSYKGAYNIGPRQLTSAFFIGILFMFQAALLSSGQVVVLERSLVITMFVGQFYFLTLLYFQTEVAIKNKEAEIMLNENIKRIRKSKGLSQEELAIKLNVVRQTVSKWENGLSVPDSSMLIILANELDTTVSELLGEPVAEPTTDDLKILSEKLEVINLQLAKRSITKVKTIRWILISLCAVIVVIFIALASTNSFYLNWNYNYNDPELAVAGTILHGFEFLFVRLAPIVFLTSVVGVVVTYKKR